VCKLTVNGELLLKKNRLGGEMFLDGT